MPAHDRGGAPLSRRRVHRDGAQAHALARQLHPRRRRQERGRRLPLAPEGRRHRAAADELRHGARPPRHHRHAPGEPPVREGAQEGAGRSQGRVIRRLTVLGLGLLGGSVAKGVRREGLAREIVAVGRRYESLEPALADGTVDRITTDIADGVAGADLCVLATPVATLTALMPAVWRAATDDAVITDVGSTKAGIVGTAEALGRDRPLAFVGSHPMAGSERAGYGVARVDLFRGATVVMTPTDRTPAAAVKRVSQLWEALGGRVTMLEPAVHDRAVAAISHLPHLVADALVDAVVRLDPGFLELAARGFKDTTRIAASDARMWREIFQENRAALGEALAAFRQALDHLDRLVSEGDAARIEAELNRIRLVREKIA